MAKSQSLKQHQLFAAMRERGFTLVRHCSGGHSLWRHTESGKVMTIGTHVHNHSFLDTCVRKLLRETY